MSSFPHDIPSGAYSLTYNSSDVGILEGQPRLVYRMGGINHTAHLFGANVIEIVDTGIESMFVIFTPKNWNAVTKGIFWPFGTMGDYGKAFRNASDYRLKSLVFTAEPGSPAATKGPVTRTFPLAGLAVGQNLEMAMGGAERNVTVVMQVLAGAESPGSHSSLYFIDT